MVVELSPYRTVTGLEFDGGANRINSVDINFVWPEAETSPILRAHLHEKNTSSIGIGPSFTLL